MEAGQIWKSKEVKGVFLKILEVKADGTVVVSFELSRFYPRRSHNYHPGYLDTFYENTGDVITWEYQA